MTYLILWRAMDHPTLFESEEYESRPEAEKSFEELRVKYPWNTYLLVQIEKAAPGDREKRPNTMGNLKIIYDLGTSL